MPFSTEDCRNFLAGVFSKHFSIIKDNFTDSEAGANELRAHVCNSKNWKRVSKVSATTETDNYVPEDPDSRMVFSDDYRANRYMDIVGGKILRIDEIKSVREFDCAEMEGQLRFLVFETQDRLYLGRYVGD